MIWMLYYTIGFWTSFGLVVLRSSRKTVTVDGVDIDMNEKSPAIVGALVIAMAWPVCLPLLAFYKFSSLFRKSDGEVNDDNESGQGYPTILHN